MPGARGAGSSGQASVEAAFLLPTLLVVLGMLLQPACILFTRMIMMQAAAETARLLVTAEGGAETCRSFCLRRLRAVPDAALFHTGGEDDWEIDIVGSDSDAAVSISGHARPLPLFGLLAGLVLEHDAQGVVISASYSIRLRPSWLEGGENDWSDVWES